MSTEREELPTWPVVSTIRLRSVEYPVTCDSYGVFRASVEGHELNSQTMRDLMTQADRVPRRKVAVRFAVVSPGAPPTRMSPGRKGTVSRGTATGFHAISTNSLLVNRDGAKRNGAMTGERIENAVAIDADQEATVLNLMKDAAKAELAVTEFIAAHAIDVHQLVREALAKGDDDDE